MPTYKRKISLMKPELPYIVNIAGNNQRGRNGTSKYCFVSLMCSKGRFKNDSNDWRHGLSAW